MTERDPQDGGASERETAPMDGNPSSPVVETDVKKEKRPRDPEKWIHRPIEKYRKGKHAFAYRPGPEFFELADPVVRSERTLLGYDRLYVFWQAIQNVSQVPGSVAEIGTYRGGSAYFIASALRTVTGQDVPFLVFDTFEGHPAAAISEQDPFHTAGQFSGTSYDDVRAYLAPFPRIQMHQGDVSTVLPRLESSAYRLVHIDTDLFQPTLACLQYFGTRLSPGGVCVLDDYASAKCPGVRAAVGQYLDDTDAFQAWDVRTEQLMLVKR
jgi:O-methyltransferase